MCGTGKIKDINNTVLLWDPDRGRDLEEDLDMEKSLRYIGDYIYDNAAFGSTGAPYVHPGIKITKTTEDKLGYISAADKLDGQQDIGAASNLKGQSAINAIGNLGGKSNASTSNRLSGSFDTSTINSLPGQADMSTICNFYEQPDVSIIYSFYDNAGFILFLYSLAYDLQDEKYLSLAQSSLREFESYYERKFRQIECWNDNHAGQEVGDNKNKYAGNDTESEKNNYISQDSGAQKNKHVCQEAEALENNMVSQGSIIVTAAFVYIYYNLSRMYSDNKFYEKYLHYINELNQYDLIDNYNNDEKTIKEYAVITILCLNIYQSSDEEQEIVESTGTFASQEVPGRDTALNIAQKYSKYLSTHFKNHDNTNLKTNFSIYSLAFFMAGKILENEDYYNMGLNLIKEENHLCSYGLKKRKNLSNSSAGQIKKETDPGDSHNSNSKNNNKNLHLTGILGNLLARSRMLNYIKDEDMEIVRAPIINSLQDVLEIEGEEYSDISLCSGIFGKLEIISTLAYELKSSVLIKKSETMLKSYLSYIKEKQIESMIQNEKLNFNKGLTGIGYSILRQKNCRIPSILTFDVFKSDMEII